MHDIRGVTVLILGGAGQVGFAMSKKILERNPLKLVVCGLYEKEVEKTIEELKTIKNNETIIEGEWGNIFVRQELKDRKLNEILVKRALIEIVVEDIFSELDEDTIQNSWLYQIINKHRPDIIIDSINTASALAYQDVYSQISRENDEHKWIYLAAAMDLPQLIRHIQILVQSMKNVGVKQYLKIGTSGTGGLGFTIPFNHGENEIPSRLLMGKSAIAGAQTMLLWILARTTGAPSIKEIKVTSLIGWHKIGSGRIKTKRGEIELYDCPFKEAQPIEKALKKNNAVSLGKKMEGVWIDTGENGLFTRHMFAAITAPGGMEMITPEEIAEIVINELEGKDTGKDIIHALDRACLGPTFKGMAHREKALAELRNLEGSEEIASIHAMGPLASKILWEAALLQDTFAGLENITKFKASEIEKKTVENIKNNQKLRSKIISVGIPILLPNGKILRGPEICVPTKKPRNTTIKDVEKWALKGWVDLRFKNWIRWINRLEKYQKYVQNLIYGENYETKHFEVGEVCGWVFAHELGGLRNKR